MFQKYYRNILIKICKGEIQSNTHYNQYIVKVICGYGHGRVDKNYDGLKEKFYHYLKENQYDFIYLFEHGAFLIRAQF